MLRERSSPGGNGLRAVPPPKSPIYRVGRPLDPFDPPPWDKAGEDGTFGNRFDDPGHLDGIPQEQRFRMIYCATQRTAVYGETLARFRPSLTLLEKLAEIEDDEPPQLDMQPPVIPADWRVRRRLGKTRLVQALRFVDLADPHNLQVLRSVLASQAHELGLDDIDLSAVIGPHRTLTQHLARYVYEQVDENGLPLFAGIRYLSRLNADWECWAIFDTRMQHTPAMPESILPDDPGLIEVIELFGFNCETLHGALLRG